MASQCSSWCAVTSTSTRGMHALQAVAGHLVQCGPIAAAAHLLERILSQPAAEGDGLRGGAPHPGLGRPPSAPGAHA